jgi:hypothetical protein
LKSTIALKNIGETFVTELEGAVPGLTIEWIYFEADIERANQNCRRRTNKNDPMGRVHIDINRTIGSRYKTPPGVTPRPIFQLPES